MVPGLLERERLNAEAHRRDLLATAARELLVDEAVANGPRAGVPTWRWSLGGFLIGLGGRLRGAGWAERPAAGPAPVR